jgi:cardiolipin hydrolase
MTTQDFAALLDRSLEDHHLSRNERQSLAALAARAAGDEQKLIHLRKLAFEKAGALLKDAQARDVLGWLEEVVKVLHPKAPPAGATAAGGPTCAEVYFSPGDECIRRLLSLLGAARRSLDICVFTITDDRITSAIVAAQRRGVAVRIISDNDKAGDLGSDIEGLEKAGVKVRLDDSPHHMHHKFVVVDGKLLLNGSFNWTRSASLNNQENFLISDDARFVAAFAKEFEKLWAKFGAF